MPNPLIAIKDKRLENEPKESLMLYCDVSSPVFDGPPLFNFVRKGNGDCVVNLIDMAIIPKKKYRELLKLEKELNNA